MKLVVFDMDGTLTRTSGIDGQYFEQALADTFGIDAISTDWSDYDHVTDASVLESVFQERLGRPPSSADVSRVVTCFVGLLEQRYREDPEAFRPVAGAGSILARLRTHGAWRAAIATGGWERPARFKSRAARLDGEAIPAAFAEDGPSRESIVRTAIARASRAYGESSFDRVVTVGDASWDVQTAQALKLPFVGIGKVEREAELRSLGARHVLRDFLDPGRFFRCLEEAVTPLPSVP